MPQSNTADSLQKEKSEEKLNFMQKETKQLIFQERKHRKERKGNGGRGGEGKEGRKKGEEGTLLPLRPPSFMNSILSDFSLF